MADVVVVLGMHRSGTSSVAGVLTKLGCTPPKHVMPANAGNARGYFESMSFMMFHDELLNSAGSMWSDWRQFNPSWFQSSIAASFRQRAKELFADEFDNQPLSILKDPRVCRFAPFWLDVLGDIGVTPRVVIPIRYPLEVAQSLRAIHRLPLSQGLLLWLRHVLDAEYSSRAVKRSIFTWSEFREDWRQVCDRIASETGVVWPRLSDRVAREIDIFLSSELVHYETKDNTTEWVSRAYDALVELARNPFSNSAQAELDSVRFSLDQASNFFGRLLIDYEVDLEEVRGESDLLRNSRDAQANEHDTLRRELENQTLRNAALETTLFEAIREKELLVETLSTITADRDTLSDSRANLEETQSRNDELAEALFAISEERDNALKMRENMKTERDALAVILEQSDIEKLGLASNLENIQFQSLQTMAALEATRKEELAQAHGSHSAIVTDIERSHSDHVRKIRVELLNAEAAFYCAKLEAERPVLKRLIPITQRRRKLARLLLSSGLFDADYYCSHYPDHSVLVAASPTEIALAAALHYVEYGFYQGFQPNPVFDSSWYLEHYEDVRRAGLNPLWHYFRYGWREGRDPGPSFNTNYYLSHNPDVMTSGTNPMLHYIHFGRYEGRQPTPKA